jgi:Tfp pilus assembly protein PilV
MNIPSKAKESRSGFTLILLMVLVVLMMIGALASAPSVLVYAAQRVQAGKNQQMKLDVWSQENLREAPFLPDTVRDSR